MTRRGTPGRTLDDGLVTVVVVELGKFPADGRGLPGLGTDDTWCWLMKRSGTMRRRDYEDLTNKGGEMAEVARHLWRISRDETVRRIAEAREKERMDRESEVETARVLGREEGHEEGREEGFEEGIEKGIEKGLKKAALRMLEGGMAPAEVAGFSGLPEKAVQALRKKDRRKP